MTKTNRPLTVLLSIVAVTALLGLAQSNQKMGPAGPANLAIEGVTLGMTEQQVLALRGQPISRSEITGGFVDLEYPANGIVYLKASRSKGLTVVYLTGGELSSGTQALVKQNDRESLALSALQFLGQPQRNSGPGCAKVPSLFDRLTFDLFAGNDDSLTYPRGLHVSMLDSRVSEISLEAPHAFEPSTD